MEVEHEREVCIDSMTCVGDFRRVVNGLESLRLNDLVKIERREYYSPTRS
jgi:hypothetical protein